MLGLEDAVDADQFEALRNNQNPITGERLTPRTKETRQPTVREAEDAFRKKFGRNGSALEVANFRLAMKPLPNRVAFYDYQCSAQKSVSIMAIVGGDERLREAHERATKKAFAELEGFASRQKNTAVQRAWEMTGNLCAAAFTHDASRALDPQLHTHFVIANATYSCSGQWYALEECHMYKAVRYAGKVYQNELAREVKALGYNIREVRDGKRQVTGFEIEGVSDEVCTRFAKRRAEIEREMEKFERKHGRVPSSAEIAQITRETRGAKLAEITTPEVRAGQRAQLLPEEWKQLQDVRIAALKRVKQGAQSVTEGLEQQALQAAVAHLFERRSVAAAHEILAETLNQALGSVDLPQIQRAVANEQANLVRLTARDDTPLLAECCTRYGLELERWSVAFVNATRNRCGPLNEDFFAAPNLSPEQREAVCAILSTRDQVFSFRGIVGAGKTTTLREVHRGLRGRGHRAVYIAPTAAAAKVLQTEGFADATTVEDFLQNVARQENLNGAVIVCDEAGLKSNRQGAALLHLAQQRGLRVLLVGDVRQHVSVEAGDFLRVLETHSQLGRCEVAQIRRQEAAPHYRAAVERMADGDARGGMAALDALGWLHEGGAEYVNRAAADYLRLTQAGTELERALLVAPTWAENHRLTEVIRAGLKASGQLAQIGNEFTVHDSLQWTTQQKRRAANYQAGHLIIFNRQTGIWKAGDFVEVRRVTAKGEILLWANGVEHQLSLRAAEHFDVGRPRLVEVAAGDKLLVRANQKRFGLINGQVLTVDRIETDGAILTKEGVRLPSSFRRWCHGYVVTSHKAQGRTCEHVIVVAERLDAKSAYVACSRGKFSCTVHTPEKRRLLDGLPEGSRRAALDVLAESVKPMLEQPEPRSLAARVQAWARLLPTVAAQKTEKAKTYARRKIERVRQAIRLWHRYSLFRQSRALTPEREDSVHGIRSDRV